MTISNQPHAMDALQDYAKEHGWSRTLLDVASLLEHEGDRVMKVEGLATADYFYRAADIIGNASKLLDTDVLETV